MCTGQLYRIVDFRHQERGRNRQKYFMFSDPDYNVYDLFPHPRYLVQQVPCGKCLECKLQKASEWSDRLMKELKYHKDNVMITLTYDDESVPRTPDGNNYTLQYKDIQDFNKRLRKHYGEDIKFFCAGEYGSNDEYFDRLGRLRVGTERPHYHIIYFGLNVEDMKFFKWSRCEWSKEKNALYKSATIDKLWKHGICNLNEVNRETINYVARYTTKKLYGDEAEEEYTNKGKVPPFLRMSQGLAKQFFIDNIEKFKVDEKMFVVSKKGLREMTRSRYFDKLLIKSTLMH